MRVFLSIEFPEKVIKEIRKIQEVLPEFHGKKIESENLHLTLKFLGEISDEKVEEVRKKLREIRFKKFELKINSIGVFSESFIRIIWLGISNCEKLQQKIDEVLKNSFEPEERFMSHLTIARVKSIKDKTSFLKSLNQIKIPQVNFIVDNFKLKESILMPEGPVYKTIEEYNFGNIE
jgi:2'-5' RNA ligase